MSKLDGLTDTLFASAAKAFEPMLKRQVDVLWPKIDKKIDEVVPKVIAVVVPAMIKVLEAQLPKITDRIVDELGEQLPIIVDKAIRAIIPDAIEKGFPVTKLADEITKRLRGLLGGGGLGGLIPGLGR